MKELLKRREAIVEEHAAQEKYDPHWQAEKAAGRPLTARPIAFLCNDEVVFVADCVGRLLSGLEAFFAKIGSDAEALAARLEADPAFAQAVEVSRRLLEAGPAETIRLPQQHYNGVALAMGEAERDVVLADGKVAVPVDLLGLLRKRG